MGERPTNVGPAQHSFGDPAFEPQPNFDFDEQNGSLAMLNGMGSHQNSYLNALDDFGDGNANGPMFGNWSNRYDNAFQSMPRQSSRAVDPSHVWEAPEKQQSGVDAHGTPYPHSTQSDIIKSRGGTVNESFGNLTPPEDSLPDAPPASTNTKAPFDRSERARNAALQRHAKTKKGRVTKESKASESDSVDGSDVEVGDKKERYREKNRAAAAKCRAKKKTHTEKVELDARSLETENTVLKAKVRELRNQHSELRNFALQHNAAVPNCHCTALHQYNLGKAAELTSNFGRYGPAQGHSPHDNNLSPLAPSPDGFGAAHGRHQSFSGATPPMMHLSSRHQSFGAPSGVLGDGVDHMPTHMEDAYPGYSQR